MLKLTFKQTQAEIMVRAASTVLFNALSRSGYPLVSLSQLSEEPQYGFTASAEPENIGPKLVRITDLQDGGINWNTVPYCKCDKPEQYLLEANDILFARTGATTGKTHLVKQAENAVFASYLIRLRPKSNVLPEYLYFFFQSDAYWSQISEEKEGSAQPNVNGKKLINIQIPLVDDNIQSEISKFLAVVRERQDGSTKQLPNLPPPLEDQRRVVLRIEELAAKVGEARGLRSKTVKEAQALETTATTRALEGIPINGYLGEVLLEKPRNGWSARCDNVDTGVAVLSLGAVTGFTYRNREFKRTSEPTSQDAHYWLQKEDLLITRSNTPELVGHAAIYDGSPSPCIYPDLMMRLVIDAEQADKKFVHRWLKSAFVRDYISRSAKGTSPTMKKITQGTVMGIPFPSSLSLREQHLIVKQIDDLQAKVDTLKRLQYKTEAELNALLPSILDKAFKGEL